MNDNYLIAEFIDMDSCSDGWFDYANLYGNNKTYYELEFHKSWDWLIPVVAKIWKTTLENKHIDNEGI